MQPYVTQTAHAYLAQEAIKDDLSYTIIEGMCSCIEEYKNASGEKIIRLTIKRNII